MYEVIIETGLSAAHRLRGYQGTCEDLHGHNWKVEVAAAGDELDETGLLLDFRLLKKAAQEVVSEFDHTYLNDLPRFREVNPTTENIARAIFDEVARRLVTDRARVAWVRVWESATSSAVYRP